MKEYPKINSIYKRDEETGKFLEGQWSSPEFEYLANNQWIATEKVDGTNIRIIYSREDDPEKLSSTDFLSCKSPGLQIKGKTDNSQTPKFLLTKLEELFPLSKFKDFEHSITLYGEGYGEKIQSGGKYCKGQDFILFDVKVGNWWLKREDVENIAQKLEIKVVPIVCPNITLNLNQAIDLIKNAPMLDSLIAIEKRPMEGLVLTPLIPLFTRAGHRIITKIKYKDFGRKN
jgi:hypothetical protein